MSGIAVFINLAGAVALLLWATRMVRTGIERARQLVDRKEAARNLVRASEEQHLQRLRSGNVASFESSSLHTDTMRDLKEINSLFASIAYPLLEQEGLLRRSRLL